MNVKEKSTPNFPTSLARAYLVQLRFVIGNLFNGYVWCWWVAVNPLAVFIGTPFMLCAAEEGNHLRTKIDYVKTDICPDSSAG